MTVADSHVEQSGTWPRWFTAASTLLTSVVVYFYATRGTMNPRQDYPVLGSSRFFWAQASAMAHGRLSVLPDYLAGECFVSKGKCFGYYGLTPSILRLPLLPLLSRIDSGLATVGVTLGLGLAFWSALDLVRRILKQFNAQLLGSRWLMWFFAVQLGVGSVLMFTTWPMVYQEAMAWSLGFGMLTLNLAWRRVGEGWAPWWAIVTAGVLAANSRPTMLLVCLVLGAWLLLRAIRQPDRSWRAMVGPALIAVLPALTAVGVWMVKFGEPLPDLRLDEEVPENPVWQYVLDRNGDVTQGFVFVPTATVAYLRPDGVNFIATAPFIDLRWHGADFFHSGGLGDRDITYVFPLAEGGVYSEKMVPVTDVMPLAVASLASAVPLARRRRRRKRDAPSAGRGPDGPLGALGAMALAASAGLALTLSIVSMTSRYVSDFYPLTVVALAAACVALPPGALNRVRWRVLLAVGAAWSTWIALGLMWRITFAGA